MYIISQHIPLIYIIYYIKGQYITIYIYHLFCIFHNIYYHYIILRAHCIVYIISKKHTTILYYIILYYIILYCIILYYSVLYYIILYYIILYIPYITSHHVTSCTVPYRIVSQFAQNVFSSPNYSNSAISHTTQTAAD